MSYQQKTSQQFDEVKTSSFNESSRPISSNIRSNYGQPTERKPFIQTSGNIPILKNMKTLPTGEQKNAQANNSLFSNLLFGSKQLKQNKSNNPTLTKDKRPQTLVSPARINNFSLQSDFQANKDTFMMIFHSSPNYVLQGTPSQNEVQINIRSFNSKFIRQLNFKENQKARRYRRKLQNINNKITDVPSMSLPQSSLNSKKLPKKNYNRKHFHQIYQDGMKILGQYKNDVLHGQAQIFYPNGAKFSGRYQHGMRVSGYFDFNNGYCYDGGFLGDKFHGDGQLIIPNGKSFSGDWVENNLVGKVQIRYPSQDLYYGQIQNFRKHGRGYLFFKNGDKYVGQFKNGQIFGKGQYFQDQICVGRGIWKMGELIQELHEQQFSSDVPSTSMRNFIEQSKISSRSHNQKIQVQLRPQKSQLQTLQQLGQNFNGIDERSQQKQRKVAQQQINLQFYEQQIKINQIRSNKQVKTLHQISQQSLQLGEENDLNKYRNQKLTVMKKCNKESMHHQQNQPWNSDETQQNFKSRQSLKLWTFNSQVKKLGIPSEISQIKLS